MLTIYIFGFGKPHHFNPKITECGAPHTIRWCTYTKGVVQLAIWAVCVPEWAKGAGK